MKFVTECKISIINIMTVIVFYIAVSSILPELIAYPWHNHTIIFAMFLWIILAFMQHPGFFIKPKIYTLTFFFFAMYTIIIAYGFGNATIGNRYMLIGQFFLFNLIYSYNYVYGYHKQSKKIVKYTIPFIVYTSIRTIIGLRNNPYLVRSIKTSDEHSDMLRAQGIGGYEFIYFLVIIVSLTFFIFLMRRQLILRKMELFLTVGFTILGGLTIILSNYFTAFLVMSIGLFIQVITKKRKILLTLFYTIIGFVCLIFYKKIFLFITNQILRFLERGATVDRIIVLQSRVLGNGVESSLIETRSITIMESLNVFYEYPLFGSIVRNEVFSGGFYLIGNHSFIIDTFAIYGIFIGFVNLYLIISPFIKRKQKCYSLKCLNISVLTSVIIILLMNNLTPSIGYAAFFIYPVLYNTLENRLVGKEKNNISKVL